MYFKDRSEAGKLLASRLAKYKEGNVVVYALPRGGIIIGNKIADHLHAPLDVIITRKIGSPYQPEYAIAAITEHGRIVKGEVNLAQLDKRWLHEEIDKEKKEILRRRSVYLLDLPRISAEGKIAIIADDGIATGLTMRASVSDVKAQHPAKIIIAVPIIPQDVLDELTPQVDEIIRVDSPASGSFLGAISLYYASFPPVNDADVIDILEENRKKCRFKD